jgi:hypothetical protein
MALSEYYPELFSVFFTNQILNGVYNAAEANVRDKKYSTLAESYRHGLTDYQRAITDPPGKTDHFKTVLKNLHTYVIDQLSSLQESEGKDPIKIIYTDFLDTIAVFFLPKDAYAEIANSFKLKQNAIRSVLSKTITRFVCYITDTEMNFVLNPKARQDQANSERCCDKFKEILQDEIHKFSSIIMAKNAGVEVKSSSDANKLMVARLQQALQQVLLEKSEVEKKLNGAQQFIAVLKNTIGERDRTIETLQKRSAAPARRPIVSNQPNLQINHNLNGQNQPNQNQPNLNQSNTPLQKQADLTEFNPPNLDELGDLDELSENL